MRMFRVPAGTTVRTIEEGHEWTELRQVATTEEKVFDLEEMIVDPIGRVGVGPSSRTIGGSYAEHGWYGFRRDGVAVLVPGNAIEVL